jgi:hypothetical protein
MRENPDLDRFMRETDPDAVPIRVKLPMPQQQQRKRTRKAGAPDRDQVRRRAFRVLALLADLDAQGRARVLKAAERLNRA